MAADLVQRRIAELRRQRVNARRIIERAVGAGGDWLDRRHLIEEAQGLLRSTQYEWAQLMHATGQASTLRGSVRLNTPAKVRSAAPRARSVDLTEALRRRGLDGHSYVTKVMTPGNRG
jgi:hypothetical protein